MVTLKIDSPFTIALYKCTEHVYGLPKVIFQYMAYLVTQPCLTEEVWGSQTLQRLVKQLQYFNQLPRANEEIEKDCCGIGSDFGLFKSLEVKNDQSSRVNWRERRAAVLICLFEGQDGELQVILTKRSMKLSSQQGKLKSNCFLF